VARALNPHKVVPITAKYVAAATAILVLAGWVSGIPALTSISSGLAAMKANTAIGLLLLAAALHCVSARQNQRCQRWLAVAVVALGVVTLGEYIFKINIGIDEALFRDPALSFYPGRMSPVTASNFILLGAAMALPRFHWSDYVKEALALLVSLSAIFSIVGYIYGVPSFYGVVRSGSGAVALHTGISFLALALGFLFVERDTGFVRVFEGPSIASIVARYMVPIAVLVPVALGAFFLNSRWNPGQPRLVMALSVVSDMLLLVTLIWILAVVIQRVEKERALIKHQAETDRLTGIYNRRYFETSMEAEVQRARRYEKPLSLLLFDVDRFKDMNDRYGHLAGDRILERLVRECESNLRATDVFCRYGGEEFVIIAPETTGQAGTVLARRIREAVEAMRLDPFPGSVTISVGIAAWGPDFATSEDFIAAADAALYLAKRMGRNRECLYVKTPGTEVIL
jgi:diguanylate cyclase (GGDEF)-like protein